jgi:hypothetical protein
MTCGGLEENNSTELEVESLKEIVGRGLVTRHHVKLVVLCPEVVKGTASANYRSVLTGMINAELSERIGGFFRSKLTDCREPTEFASHRRC